MTAAMYHVKGCRKVLQSIRRLGAHLPVLGPWFRSGLSLSLWRRASVTPGLRYGYIRSFGALLSLR